MEEAETWADLHPDRTLLTTDVCGYTVRVRFNPFAYYIEDDCADRYPLQVSVDGDPRFRGEGAWHWEHLLEAHASAVARIKREWFRTSSSVTVEPGCDPSTVRTQRTDLAPTDPRPTPEHSMPQPPALTESVWYRLLAILSEGPKDYYALHRTLGTDRDKYLSALEAAWGGGLLLREERESFKPPVYSLSLEGHRRHQLGHYDVRPDADGNYLHDLWEPGWDMTMSHDCPICGFELWTRTRYKKRVLLCDSKAGSEEHYVADYQGDQVTTREGQRGRIKACGSAAENRSQLFVGNELQRTVPYFVTHDRFVAWLRLDTFA